MRLTDHFSLTELTKSQTAERLGISNEPDDAIINNLVMVCTRILEPVRANYGIPFTPSSAYRSAELNKRISGSPTSSHIQGLAVDIEVPTIRNPDLARWIAANVEGFDQIILECWSSDRPGSGWVHCGLAAKGRGETLTYEKGKGYLNGFPS